MPVTDSPAAYYDGVKEYPKAKAVWDYSFKLMPEIYGARIYV